MDGSGLGCSSCPDNIISPRLRTPLQLFLCKLCTRSGKAEIEQGRGMSKNSGQAEVCKGISEGEKQQNWYSFRFKVGENQSGKSRAEGFAVT
ncbi:hypothetical protein PBOR_29160 [Paenibacillus borealis]|uniref:Uncharacterized protein n=1 Tax=Paenibacillus borealis TaxID=160799 RepID=A0A089LGB6_PAEBO|nr:hypothetical protein PBOR_29160 [Paenibacillus borealis]